jgi:YesN/AraC family two-component response regulator
MQPVILIVDDEEVLLELTKTFLIFKLRIPEEYILTAGNGAKAWEIINSRKIGLVISDFNMPVLDGLELLKKIRNSTDIDISSIHFIATSVCSDFERELFLKEKADYFFFKPFKFDEMSDACKTLLKI